VLVSKSFEKRKSIIFLFFGLAILAACIPSGDDETKGKYEFVVNRYEIGEHVLHIPYAYTRFHLTSVGGESGLIQAYYPGSSPVIQGTENLRESGKYVNRVHILFTDLKRYQGFDPKKSLQGAVDHFAATELAGQEFGLTKLTQAKGVPNPDYKDELWIASEPSTEIVYISCSKEARAPAPQCKHKFYDDKFLYSVTYDKRQLKNWATIRDNVIELMHSFRSAEAAEEFVREKFYETYFEQMGEKP
jgi:hypothetical protein|tara:strand:- start:1001 stop:1738 length:738 start_codon:yes stop_codon:yes gene_type:complete